MARIREYKAISRDIRETQATWKMVAGLYAHFATTNHHAPEVLGLLMNAKRLDAEVQALVRRLDALTE